MTSTTLPDDVAQTWSDDGLPDRARTLVLRLRAWAVGNRLFAGAVAVAALLRLLVAIAYAPALEFFGDSPAYLAAARQPFHVDIWHPFGYPVLLWLLSATRSLAVVTTVQHVLGLLTGVLLYRLMRRLGVGAVGATLAAAPVLFDAYQLDVEQFVLSDTLFTFLVVAALAATERLLCSRSTRGAIGVGALLGAAALTRTVGLAVAAAVIVVVLVGRIGWSRALALAATMAIPVGAYTLAFHGTYGVYAMQGYGGRYLYGLVAPFASCRPDQLPPEQRSLCPTLPNAARPGSNEYVWGEYNAAHLPGNAIERSQIAGTFARTIVRNQPGQAFDAVVGNLGHYFRPGRSAGPRDWYVGSWQFPTADIAPAWNIRPATVGFRTEDRLHGHVDAGLAGLLRTYQRLVFTPGPLLLAALLVAAAACCFPRGDSHTRRATGLLGLSGLALLVLPSVSAGFDWRYLLPAQAVLVPATVTAGAVLRAPVRRLTRRATPVVVGAVVAALAAPGLASPSVYAASTLRPPDARPAVPATLSVGGHAAVRVGTPALVGVSCWRTPDEGRKRLLGLVAFPAEVSYLSGPPKLVQMSNFGLSNGELAVPGIRPAGDVLRGFVLSARYPRTRGTVYAYVTTSSGTLRYVDPYGGGAAAWSFHLTEAPRQAPLGSPCTGTAPWAGMQLRYLRIHDVAPFTALTDQRFTYGLSWQPWRADSYDVRFRIASPTSGPGPWQFPPTWQRVTVTEQSLVNLSPGVTYCFSVRARDALGAVTDWSDPTCTARMYDDAALPPSADWSRFSGRDGFSFGTYTATKAQNATLSVGGTFSRVGLSVYRCPGCGVLDVYVGGRLIHSLDLDSPAADEGLVQWTSPTLPDRATTLTLRVRSRDRLVAIDGLGLLR